ncbi:InlB B-repeat-containing protein, partial [Candidatus Saccharibacteria bacterium]|nr:InlB B-repeat-containing protein [Candidatus Saccharibacteria bacterium]
FDPSAPITDDLTIYANYNLDNYTVRYNLNGGEVAIANKTDYTINDTFTLNNPTKAHYNFVGWTGTGLSNPTKDVTVSGETGSREYVANYAPIDYRISYSGLTEAEEDTLNNLTTYNIETSEFSLNNPANRTDADGDVTEIFAGWKEGASTSMTVSLPNQNSLGDKTFEATWTAAEPTTYTIGYELNDGTLSVENAISFTKFTETFTLNNPSKTGYVFIGWTGSNGATPQKEVKVEKGTRHTLYFVANYEPNKYSVIFDKNATNASGEMANQTLTYDTKSPLNNNQFVRTGYSFAGWNTKKDKSGTHYDNQAKVKNLATSGSVTLYAEWEANTYEIAFDANTGSGTMSNFAMTYDVEKNLPANAFVHTTYIFNGWNTKKDGTGTSYSNQAKVKNLATSGTITLYAQWKRQTLYAAAKLGDYVRYTPSVASYNISGDGSYCYYGPTDRANGNAINAMSVSPSSVTSWRVVSKDDSAKTVTLVPATSGGTVTMNGRGYGCYEDNLSRISAQFKDNTFAASSNYMTEANYQLVKKSGVGIIDNAAIGKKEIIASDSYLGYYVYYSLNNNSERFEIANQRSTPTSLTLEYSFFDKEFNILPLVTIKTGILVNSGSGTSASPWMMTTE